MRLASAAIPLLLAAGHPGRPWLSPSGCTLCWYQRVILGYAFACRHIYVGSLASVPLSPLGALVFSVTSFHGRGFFPGGSPGHSITLDDPLTVLAASEAIVGLLIEISFIATFTQRYFGAK